MNTHTKKLYKSETDALVWGVIGGLGEYADIDPTVLRLGYIILALVTGIFPCVIAYIIAYFIIPEKPMKSHESRVESPDVNTVGEPTESVDFDSKKKQTEVKAETKTAPLTQTEDTLIQKEMEAFDIKNEDKEKFAPGERETPEVAVELAIPDSIDVRADVSVGSPTETSGLKKPNWPKIDGGLKVIKLSSEKKEETDHAQTTATIDSLTEENKGVNLHDVM